MMIDLKQEELDEVFYLSQYQCEAAAARVIKDALQDRSLHPLRDALIQGISAAFADVAEEYIGQRFPSLVDRLSAMPVEKQ